MHVVVRQDVLDARQALAANRPGEHEVGERGVAARRVDPGEADAGLERDARARRVDRDRPERADGVEQRVERLAQAGRRPREVLVDLLDRAWCGRFGVTNDCPQSGQRHSGVSAAPRPSAAVRRYAITTSS